MFDFVLQTARKQGMSRVWLGVWEENREAIRFYKKLGFKEFDRHVFMMGKEAQTDLMLKLQLWKNRNY